jgi:hypothetical protein
MLKFSCQFSEGIRIVKIRKVATESLGFGIRGGKQNIALRHVNQLENAQNLETHK